MGKFRCMTCGVETEGKGDHPYHAGFGDEGFLYCSRDTTVLSFSSYDPFYTGLFEKLGQRAEHPWTYAQEGNTEALRLIERHLVECPCGGKFSFDNPLRCPECGCVFSEPLSKTIYYVVLDRVLDG
ncbi:MAG TPA: hypothetical protein VF374_08460, partial [Thermoplasmata archaeon]